jgi:hypothetical protein
MKVGPKPLMSIRVPFAEWREIGDGVDAIGQMENEAVAGMSAAGNGSVFPKTESYRPNRLDCFGAGAPRNDRGKPPLRAEGKSPAGAG